MFISSLWVNPKVGGMQMLAQDYWQMFLETGAPEMYLLYNNARKTERSDVLDDSGLGAAGHSL